MKLAINTFYTKSYQSLSDITIPNMQTYANKHGYDFYETISPEGKFHFVKTQEAYNLIQNYDAVLSIEADVLITNHFIKIEDFIDDEHDIFLSKDINGVNSGVIIWKATEACKKYLEEIELCKNIYADEQTVFEHHQNKIIKYLNHPGINSIPYDYYAPSYGKYNYKHGDVVLKPTLNEGDWQQGCFTCHLPGVNLNNRIKIFSQLKEQIIL